MTNQLNLSCDQKSETHFSGCLLPPDDQIDAQAVQIHIRRAESVEARRVVVSAVTTIHTTPTMQREEERE